MDIQVMHSAFRILGQQMGMQLVRGILPEHIDIYLNAVIVEKVQQELITGVRTVLQEQVNTQSSTMSPINLFRTLYKTARIDISKLPDDAVEKVETNGYYIVTLPTIKNSSINASNDIKKISPMMYLGFSLEYDDTTQGNPIACRLIGADVLETTLRDFCNGASKDAPIVSLGSIINYDNAHKEDINIGSSDQIEIFTNTADCDIKYINIKYIKNPSVVKFDTDAAKCVHCDLPEYCHYEIVERAVQKYYMSVSALTNARKQND